MKINLTSSVIFLVNYVNSHQIILETIYFLSLCWKTYHKINHTNLDKAKSFINMTELILKIWMVGNIHLSLQEIFKLFVGFFEFLLSSECYFFPDKKLANAFSDSVDFMEECWILLNAFLHLFGWSCDFSYCCLFCWYVTVSIELWILNHSCIPGISPTWLCHIYLLNLVS